MSNPIASQRKTRLRTRDHSSYRPTTEKDSSVRFHLSVSDQRLAIKNPTRYIPDVIGFSPLSKQEIKKDQKDILKSSYYTSVDGDDSDVEIDIENITNLSTQPSCIPDSVLPHKRQRLVDWVLNPDKAIADVESMKQKAKQSHANQTAMDEEEKKWYQNFELSRQRVVEALKLCQLDNEESMQESNKILNAIWEECIDTTTSTDNRSHNSISTTKRSEYHQDGSAPVIQAMWEEYAIRRLDLAKTIQQLETSSEEVSRLVNLSTNHNNRDSDTNDDEEIHETFHYIPQLTLNIDMNTKDVSLIVEPHLATSNITNTTTTTHTLKVEEESMDVDNNSKDDDSIEENLIQQQDKHTIANLVRDYTVLEDKARSCLLHRFDLTPFFTTEMNDHNKKNNHKSLEQQEKDAKQQQEHVLSLYKKQYNQSKSSSQIIISPSLSSSFLLASSSESASTSFYVILDKADNDNDQDNEKKRDMLSDMKLLIVTPTCTNKDSIFSEIAITTNSTTKKTKLAASNVVNSNIHDKEAVGPSGSKQKQQPQPQQSLTIRVVPFDALLADENLLHECLEAICYVSTNDGSHASDIGSGNNQQKKRMKKALNAAAMSTATSVKDSDQTLIASSSSSSSSSIRKANLSNGNPSSTSSSGVVIPVSSYVYSTARQGFLQVLSPDSSLPHRCVGDVFIQDDDDMTSNALFDEVKLNTYTATDAARSVVNHHYHTIQNVVDNDSFKKLQLLSEIQRYEAKIRELNLSVSGWREQSESVAEAVGVAEDNYENSLLEFNGIILPDDDDDDDDDDRHKESLQDVTSLLPLSPTRSQTQSRSQSFSSSTSVGGTPVPIPNTNTPATSESLLSPTSSSNSRSAENNKVKTTNKSNNNTILSASKSNSSNNGNKSTASSALVNKGTVGINSIPFSTRNGGGVKNKNDHTPTTTATATPTTTTRTIIASSEVRDKESVPVVTDNKRKRSANNSNNNNNNNNSLSSGNNNDNNNNGNNNNEHKVADVQNTSTTTTTTTTTAAATTNNHRSRRRG